MRKLFLVFLFFSGCVYYNTFYNARKYYDAGEFNKSIEKCEKILTYYPDSKYVDDAIFIMGKSHYNLKEFGEASMKLKQLVDGFPDSPFIKESYLLLGKIALEKGNLDESILFLDAAAGSSDPEIRMETFKTKLKIYLMMDEPQKAIQEGKRFIEEYKEHSKDAYYIIGNANRSVGDKKEALRMYKKAIEESGEKPSDALIYSLAELYTEMDSLSKALDVIGQREDSDSLCLLKGKTMKKLEDFAAAEKSLKLVEERKDSLGVVAKYNLGEIKEIQGDTSAAFELYKNASKIGEFGEISTKCRAKKEIFENIFFLQDLAEKAEEGKEEDEENYEKKDSSYAFFRIAEIYYLDLNKVSSGVEWYEKVYKEFPESNYAPKAIFALLQISLSRDSPLSLEKGKLLSLLTTKYPYTEYTRKAKEIYETYLQDTTGS